MGERKFWIYLSLLKMYQTQIKCAISYLGQYLIQKDFGVPDYVYVHKCLEGESNGEDIELRRLKS